MRFNEMTSTTNTTPEIYQMIEAKVSRVQDLKGKVLDLEKEIEAMWLIYWQKRDEDAEATAKAEAAAAAAAENHRIASIQAQIDALQAQLPIPPRQFGYPLYGAPVSDFNLEAGSEHMSVSSEGSAEIYSEGGLWEEYHAAALSGASIYNAAAQHPHADEGDYLLHHQNMRAEVEDAAVEDTRSDEEIARELAGSDPQNYERPQAPIDEITWQQQELLEQHEEHDPRFHLAEYFPQAKAVPQSAVRPLTNRGPCPGPCGNDILYDAPFYLLHGYEDPKRCAACKANFHSFPACEAAGNTARTNQLVAQRPIAGNGIKTGSRSFDVLREHRGD